MEPDVLRIEVLHDIEQIPHDGAHGAGTRTRVVHEGRAVLLIQLDELLDLELDRIELRQNRFGEIVVVGADPVVSDAELPAFPPRTCFTRNPCFCIVFTNGGNSCASFAGSMWPGYA
jgi:hypothetical protein